MFLKKLNKNIKTIKKVWNSNKLKYYITTGVYMKIIKFIGKNIHNYLNIELSFNKELTILTGINGSGKTTILKLIVGILGPSLDYLFEIQFDLISIICEVDNENITLTLKKNKGKFSFEYVTKEQIITDDFGKFPIEKELGINRDFQNMQYERFYSAFYNSKIYKKIQHRNNLSSFLFGTVFNISIVLCVTGLSSFRFVILFCQMIDFAFMRSLVSVRQSTILAPVSNIN
jgi:hypothetical protein